ncbi:MAG: hypothetical protein R6T83_05140 [Salinibacter sp.]
MTYRYFLRPVLFWIGIGLLLTALLPFGAAAQDASVQPLLERGQEAGADADLMRTVARRAEAANLSSTATTDLLEPAVSLAEQDLPTRPVLNKALEGLSKNVPPERMRSVLQQLRTGTEQAGQLVSGWLQQEETRAMLETGEDPVSERGRAELIASVADAQQQKVSPETIESFLNELPGTTERRPVPLSNVSVAVGVLPDLTANGEVGSAARDVLVAALNAGYDAESMRQLPTAIEQARRETQQPAAAIAKGTAQAISWGTPAANVLRNLFRGAPPAGPPAHTGDGGQGQNGPPDDPPDNGPPDDPPGGGSGGGGNGGG